MKKMIFMSAIALVSIVSCKKCDIKVNKSDTATVVTKDTVEVVKDTVVSVDTLK